MGRAVRYLWLLAPLWGSACMPEAAVKGTIDGEKINLRDGFFVQDGEQYGNDDLILVILSTVKDSCEAAAEFFGVLDDANEGKADAEDMADAWKSNLPEDFWDVWMYLRIDDNSDDLGKQTLDGTDWDEGVDEDEAYADITHYTDHLDEDYWTGQGEADDYLEGFTTDEGVLTITGHKPGERIKGVFESTVVELDGDDAGEIKIRFNVKRCRDAEDELF